MEIGLKAEAAFDRRSGRMEKKNSIEVNLANSVKREKPIFKTLRCKKVELSQSKLMHNLWRTRHPDVTDLTLDSLTRLS